MPELKLCPFCGGKAILEKYQEFGGKNVYQVYCPDATTQVRTKWFHTEKEAVEAWNRRANDEV